jgi:predicted membrane-bound spermidine synthase
MSSSARPAPRLFSLAVATASMATVALELVLTRIYSVTMYYHFAFLAISVALLGLAAAGTAISLLPRVFTAERTAKLACLFMLGFAAGAVWSLGAAVGNPISLKDWTANAAGLAHIYVAAAAPLLCSGFAISLAISRAGADIGRIYMFDLVGAGVGCVLLVPAIGALGAPGALLLMAALGAVSALLFALSARATWPRFAFGAAGAGVLALALLFLAVTESGEGGARRFGLVRNPAKFLGNRPVLFEKWNSFSQITVAPAGDADHRWLFIDGDAATRMWDAATKANPEAPRRIPEVRVASLVYALRPAGPAAIIGPGGGTDVLSALRAGVAKVVGVEINPIIVDDVMRRQFAEWNGRLYDDPRVEVVVDEGRSYLRRSGQRFSSIQATLVDTWAASSSGAFTLSENNLYTVEAFGEFFAALSPGGALSVTRWYDPRSPAEFVRLLAIARAALEERGVSAAELPRHFLIATDGELRANLMVSIAPFGDADVATFAKEAAQGGIRVLYQPGLAPTPDALIAKVLTAPSLDDALAGLPYDASPTTDNKPFFFYHLRLGDLTSAFHRNAVGQLNNVGVMLLVLMLGLSVVTTLVFVIAPLWAFRRRELSGDGKNKARLLATFACLGLGFILVELGFMQQFVLFLGHPVYALAVVLATVLIASGIGAGLSERIDARLGAHRAQRTITFALAGLLFVYGLGLSPLFSALIGLPLTVRIAIAAALVAAPGLLMGTFVPASVRAANAMGPGMVAWCWGINGATSVVGSVAAVMISMNAGFTAALFTGVVIYLCAGALLPRPSQSSSTPAEPSSKSPS